MYFSSQSLFFLLSCYYRHFYLCSSNKVTKHFTKNTFEKIANIYSSFRRRQREHKRHTHKAYNRLCIHIVGWRRFSFPAKRVALPAAMKSFRPNSRIAHAFRFIFFPFASKFFFNGSLHSATSSCCAII